MVCLQGHKTSQRSSLWQRGAWHEELARGVCGKSDVGTNRPGFESQLGYQQVNFETGEREAAKGWYIYIQFSSSVNRFICIVPLLCLVHGKSLISMFKPTTYSNSRGIATDPQTSHTLSSEVTESSLASVWGHLCPLTKSADNHRS